MLASFEGWHLGAANLPAHVRQQLSSIPAFDILARLAGAGFAFTVVAPDGEILGVVGASPVGDRTAEVFVVITDGRLKYRTIFARAVKRILGAAKEQFDRLDAIADDGVSDRWFEWLGFTRVEGDPKRWRIIAEKRGSA